MRTDDLIADLAARVTPVRPLPPPSRRVIGWLAIASTVAAAGVMTFGARPDVVVRLAQGDYLWTALLALTTAILAAMTTLVLSIPGAAETTWFRRATSGVLAIWAATMVWAVADAGRGLPITTDPHWPACFARVAVVSLVPALVLFVMARRATPLRLGWTAGVAAAAAAAMGALVAQLACPFDAAGHAFLGHFLPVIAITAVGVALRNTLSRQ